MRDGETRDEAGDYASSPCMMHEFEAETDALRILYLHIAEDGGGFIWQVRLHDVPDPLAVARVPLASEAEARDAGQTALNKACGQFRRYKVLD